MGTISELLESTLLLVRLVRLQRCLVQFTKKKYNLRGNRMPCVEYHLLLILICLMKSGITLNLRIEQGFWFIEFLASLHMTEKSLVAQ